MGSCQVGNYCVEGAVVKARGEGGCGVWLRWGITVSRVVCLGLGCRGLLPGEGRRDERDGWCLAVDRGEANATNRTMERRGRMVCGGVSSDDGTVVLVEGRVSGAVVSGAAAIRGAM